MAIGLIVTGLVMLADAFQEILGGIVTFLSGVFTGDWDKAWEGLANIGKGAVIPPNREFLAVLGDQRHGTNIETPEDLLRQIFREESGNAALLPESVAVTYLDPIDGVSTRTFYGSTVDATTQIVIGGATYWEGASFSLIEM